MILVEVCPMMMLSTCHTTTTGVLAMLAYATMASRYMTTAMQVSELAKGIARQRSDCRQCTTLTYCLRVFVSRVGMTATDQYQSDG